MVDFPHPDRMRPLRRAFVMRRVALTLMVAATLGIACARAPYTQRSQLILVSESEAAQLGAQAFQQVLADSRVVRDPRFTAPVRDVGRRLAAVTNRQDYDWDFAVIDEPESQNAFALPGGKAAVFTGMFPIAQDTAGLAVVMGHEIAHVIARHGSERMSQGLAAQLGGAALGAAMSDGAAATAVMAAYGLGTQVGVLLPYGRTQETEADAIGLILMAEAGYDPRNALEFWERMAARDQGQPPEFLSTHPSPSSRIESVRQALPDALARFNSSRPAPVERLPSP